MIGTNITAAAFTAINWIDRNGIVFAATGRWLVVVIGVWVGAAVVDRTRLERLAQVLVKGAAVRVEVKVRVVAIVRTAAQITQRRQAERV